MVAPFKMKFLLINLLPNLQADSPYIKIENLTESTTYNITATVVTSDYKYQHIANMGIYTTLETNFMPENITMDKISYKYDANRDNPKVLDLEIFWKPATGMQ